ncbi:MAG: Holliday junction branch migration protein RuvA [Lachnospiraceae bacterium]|nr:Holliday junction branch migration protein RuvA [Lachnospiraceae bacterium]
MISYVAGQLVAKGETCVVVDHQGIGLEILVPGSLLEQMPAVGTEVKIYTYFHVREDAMQLFGFANPEDKELFQLLITVSGIGPKGGLALMGALTGDDIRFAILSEDAKTIAKAPGIGAKTAKKLILELKDKVDMQDSIETALKHGETKEAMPKDSRIQADAAEALTALGYSSTDALRAVRSVEITEEMTVEELLKQSLKHI